MCRMIFPPLWFVSQRQSVSLVPAVSRLNYAAHWCPVGHHPCFYWKNIWPIVTWDFCDPVNLLKISSPCEISARCPLSKRCSLVRVNLNIADIAKVWVTLSVSSLVMRGWLCAVVDHNLAIWRALPRVSQEWREKARRCKYLWRTIISVTETGKSSWRAIRGKQVSHFVAVFVNVQPHQF